MLVLRFEIMLVHPLKLFRDIALHRSVSKGAAANGVSQSAASQMLKSIESDVGVKLFDSSTRPLTITTAGEAYLALCGDVLRRWDEFQVDLERQQGRVEGKVRVAAIYSVAYSEMNQLKALFARQVPGGEIEVEYLRPERVYERVLADQADLGLVSYPRESAELTAIPWRKEEMVVAVAPAHRLAQRAQITPKELDGLDFIGFDEDLPIQHDINRFLFAQKVAVRTILRYDNLPAMKEALEQGQAAAIMPATVMKHELERGTLRAIKLSKRLHRPLGIVHRQRKRFHEVARKFLDLLVRQR